ncbi:unnamed protein product [Sphenostylis stenocarpa]|uniref:RING-type E3 ubiquitin transferase n=1 Tax=Sphenostylis stenocarpa TaxID=92480 RepID=A0AA86VGT9_9FABA|nr:unnamed protein product [Sphenostylis stenocarpa]
MSSMESGSSGQANGNSHYEEGFFDGFPHPEVDLPQESANNRLSTAPLHEAPNVEGFLQPVVNLPQQGDNNRLSTAPPQEAPNVDVQPVLNLPQQDDNNNGTSSDVLLHQTPVAPDSNITSSNSLAGSNSNTVNIPRKRSFPDHASGNFHRGESSSMGQQHSGEDKRLATESEVRANNNVNPPNAGAPIPPNNAGAPIRQRNGGVPVRPRIARAPIRPRIARTPISMQNAGAPIRPPNTRANGNANTNIGRNASHAVIPSQASLYFNGARQPSHPCFRPVQPITFQASSFMSSATPTVNNIIVRTIPDSRSSPCPHPRFDIVIPFYEHPSTSTWAPPQASPGMNHSAGANSSGTQNHQSPQQTSASATPPNVVSAETRRSLPPQVQTIVDSLSHGRGLIFEVDFRTNTFEQIQSPEPSTGLSLETIMQRMESETYQDVRGDHPEGNTERCPVCVEKFENGSQIGKLHSCEHKFHFDCIKQWLLQKNICPVCRRVAVQVLKIYTVEVQSVRNCVTQSSQLSLLFSALISADPVGGSAGHDNANNQNESSPHLSIETLERLLPLFPRISTEEGFPQPELNLPQHGANNSGTRTNVPIHETPFIAPESNLFSSSSFFGTPPNRSENVDLSLNFGLSRQGATISSAVIPSSNVAPSVHGSNSNSVNIPRKRSFPDHVSREFHQGESSNMGQETGEIKRAATESHVIANNNMNSSPPSFSLMQQQHQFLRDDHANPNNAITTVPPPITRANRITNNERRDYHGLIPSEASSYFNGGSTHSLQSPLQSSSHALILSEASLHFNGGSTDSVHTSLQSSHSVHPLSFHSWSFMSNSSSNVNIISMRNAPHSISSPCPHAGGDTMIPFYENGNNMVGPLLTSMGNFPTYRPNRSYVDTNSDTDRETARRALSFVLPHQFEPSESETLELLPGIVGNLGRVRNAQANTYYPLSDHASSSTWVPPQGSRGMHHSDAASGTSNHHSLGEIPPFPSLETLRAFPSEFQSLLHSLRDGRGLMLEQIENPEIFEMSPPSTGLSQEMIAQHMERETFLVVDEDNPEEDQEKCPVCLEEYANGEDIGKLHSCVHKFHFHCIKQWLMQKNLCPVCRRTALDMIIFE